jgi:nucleoside-diphosphate-sugar epimerase
VRVLLTGASGFIGRHTLDALLEQGHEVHAVAGRAGAPREGVVWHQADLLQPDAASRLAVEARASHLLHLAWYAVPRSFWSSPQNERWIDASLRLLRAFGEAGGRRAAMAGTCAEYAWDDEPLRERGTQLGPATPLEPATLYGACKHATHIAARAIADQLGVALVWGRIFFLYGPGEHPDRLVSGVVRGLLAEEEVPTTDGLQRRDFMHVRDVASAFVALLASDVTGPLNIASGEAVAIRDLVTMIAEVAGGLDRVRFGALPQRPGEPALIVGAVRRLTDEVGFRPAIGLADGIADVVAWSRAAHDPAASHVGFGHDH